MAECISLPFWPSSPHCIDWSLDNHIAVVGGETIAIITPRIHRKGPNSSLWDPTIIKVNGFTAAELPFEDPLSMANFSIGEDLSLRQAISAKWSFPGLAKYKGCALAILTANHVLSIWIPEGKASISSNWQRKLIVNRLIRNFYQQQNERLGEEDERHERSRVQQRVRSFRWVRPADGLTQKEDNPALQVNGRQQMLVVTTQGGQEFSFEVRSPHTDPYPAVEGWHLALVSAALIPQSGHPADEMNLGTNARSSSQNWKLALEESKASFAAEYGLAGSQNVQERLWGISSSPLQEYMATCASMHSRNSIAYIINSEQVSAFNITYESDLPSDRWLPPAKAHLNVPIETLLFSLQRAVERKTSFSQISAQDHRESIIHELLEHMSHPQNPFGGEDNPRASGQITNDSIKSSIWTLEMALFHNSDVRKEQASRIFEIALADGISDQRISVQVARRLLVAVGILQQTAYIVDSISLLLQRNYDIIAAKINPTDSDVTIVESLESCKICSEPIPFEALKWAKCRMGHEFPRCALSFVAVQQPGAMKSCGNCGLRFFNEDVIRELKLGIREDIVIQDVAGTNGTEPTKTTNEDTRTNTAQAVANGDHSKPTLTQLLFAACDVCIYCGGKFTS